MEELTIEDAKETVEDVRDIVRKFRSLNERRFPTPNVVDSARFVYTEAGEVVDAHLRLENYSRNRPQKQLEVFQELGDVLFMLVTTLGEESVTHMGTVGVPQNPDLDDIAWSCAVVHRSVSKKSHVYPFPIHTAILTVLRFLHNEGVLIRVLVDERLTRIQRRLDDQERRIKDRY